MPRRSSCRTKERREERLVRVRTCREKADEKIRDILKWRPEEKARLIRQEPHPELHGNMHAATPSPKLLQMYSQGFSVGLSQHYETSSP